MAYHRMDLTQARAFLTAGPARPGILSTARADGRPHAAPVWYDVDDDGAICFTTGADTVKGRNLRRTGYAALTVQDDRPPYSYLSVEGPVELLDDLATVRAWATRLGGRYLGAALAEAAGERNGVPGELLVRLTVSRHAGALDVAD